MPALLPTPSPSSVSGDRLVHLTGSVELFTSTMPESSFVDFSDAGTHPVFIGCWIDGVRGETAHVFFQPGVGVGTFKLALPFRDGDFDKVKVQVSMRMRDDGSGNRRTVPLCSSCAYMQPMLQGNTDTFQMPDEFINGNYARVSMSISNVGDFQAQPLRLSASNLDRLKEFNAGIKKMSASIADNTDKNSMAFINGGEQMKDGGTRYTPPCLLLVALSLMLGTPAYVFLLPPLLPLQPRLGRTGQHEDGRDRAPKRPVPLRDHERAAGVRVAGPPDRHSRVPHVPQDDPLGHDGAGGPGVER